MKYLLFTFSFFYAVVAQAQMTDAEAYYYFLQQEEIAFGNEMVKLTRMLPEQDDKILQQYQAFKNQVNIAYKNIDEKPAFQKSKYLKEASLDYIEAWQHVAKHDLKILVELFTKKQVMPNDVALSKTYFEKIEQHLKDKEEKYRKAKQQFANDHNFTFYEKPFKFYLQ